MEFVIPDPCNLVCRIDGVGAMGLKPEFLTRVRCGSGSRRIYARNEKQAILAHVLREIREETDG